MLYIHLNAISGYIDVSAYELHFTGITRSSMEGLAGLGVPAYVHASDDHSGKHQRRSDNFELPNGRRPFILYKVQLFLVH
jgi:hypothetical protein